uniref:Uncharacterized protein n=1 Tax=Lotharella globosa TaxID=91324 RepID=A0A7S3Z5X5_9EUKA
MHAQGDLKPLQTEFRFKAPSAGTGTITFHALIKVGPANTGYFFYPNGVEANIFDAIPTGDFPGTGNELTLTESIQTPPTSVWSVGVRGASCAEHCSSRGQVCDEQQLRSALVATPAGMEQTTAKIAGCPLPYTPSCASVAPARDDLGACFYSGADAAASGLCASSGPSNTFKSTCHSKHPNATRFCACKASSAVTQSLGLPEMPTVKVNLARERLAGAGTFGGVLTALASAILAGSSCKRRLRGYSPGVVSASVPLVFLVTLFMGQPSSAHNWLRSPGRAMFEASTTNPFRQRRTTDIHAQLGPGQEMAIKWATGHGRDHYFVIVNGEDESYFYKNEYKDWVRDYVSSAPENANQAPLKPRLHHCRTDSDCQNSQYFAGKASPSDSDYCDHAKFPSGDLYRWKSEHVADDRFVIYDNPKYPWIIGAMRYKNIAHMPKDFDIFCLPVPRKQGKGAHHVVHWFWNGYYDAVDVNAHYEAVPADLIYGNDTGSYEVTKIDHCQFVQPAGLATGIYSANQNVSKCLSELEKASTRPQDTGTMGVNVVPVVNPATTFTKANGVRAIPLTYDTDPTVTGLQWPRDFLGVALDSPMMTLTGTETLSTYDFTEFLSRSSGVVNNTRCYSGPTYSRFAQALSELHDEDAGYWAIAWKQNDMPVTDMSKVVATSQFRVCKTSDMREKSENGWTLFKMPAPTTGNSTGYTNPSTWTPENHLSYNISFQPANPTYKDDAFSITLPSGWHVDSGEVFGDRGSGVKYGWKCAMSTAVETSRPKIDTSNTDYLTGKIPRQGWKTRCAGGENKWEIEVPNGVYVVTMFTGQARSNYRGLGCFAENAKFIRNDFTTQYDTKALTVEVLDGRLTISNLGGVARDRQTGVEEWLYCPDMYWVQIDRLQDALPDAWVPTSKDNTAWWQLELDDAAAPVGLVNIELPHTQKYSVERYPRQVSSFEPQCSQWWFYSHRPRCYMQEVLNALQPDQSLFNLYTNPPGTANKKYGSAQAWGNFDGPDDGVVVSVSDVACTDSSCREADENVCELVTRVSNCEDRQSTSFERLCPVLVDCKGKTGRFVRVRARGTHRYLAMKSVKVHRADVPTTGVVPASGTPMVCYGLEALAPDITRPEFVISEDPTDPMFYSTCYIRSKKIEWLPIGANPPRAHRWSFNGKCLQCQSYAHNKDPSTAVYTTPHWWLSDTCKDCDGETAVWGEGLIEPPTSAPTRMLTAAPTNVPTALTAPIPSPTMMPTTQPSRFPTPEPTQEPTNQPTKEPTRMPVTSQPTMLGSTSSPTPRPTPNPSPNPTPRPTPRPTPQPTEQGTGAPTTAPVRVTPRPTSTPTSVPTSSPTAGKRWMVEVVITLTIEQVSSAFRRAFRRNLADLLGTEAGSFTVSFRAGSVVAEVTFIETDAESQAKELSQTPRSRLAQSLNVTVQSVSTPNLIVNSEEGTSSDEDDNNKASILPAFNLLWLVVLASGLIILVLLFVVWRLRRKTKEQDRMAFIAEIQRINRKAGDLRDMEHRRTEVDGDEYSTEHDERFSDEESL